MEHPTSEQPPRRIRILFFTVGLGLGGAEKILAETAIRLDRNLFDAEVLALKGWGPCGDLLKAHGVPVTVLNGGGVWDAGVLLRAARFFEANDFDIVHSHVFWANLTAGLFKKNYRLIWHEHDMDDWMSAPLRSLQKIFIRRSDAVLAISQAVADRLSGRMPFLKDRIQVVHNTVAFPAEKPDAGARNALRREWFADSPDVKIIGSVGRLEEPKKGLTVLLSAARRVVDQFPAARFVIAGDGPDRARLEKMSAKLDMTSHVRFIGAQQNVWPLYEAFDLFALPSRWEGFGIVLLEAMAKGLPVVATRQGGVPEVVVDHETGVLVPVDDEAALAGALLDTLNNPDRARTMGEAGRKRIEKDFDLAVAVKRMESIYMNCLGEPVA